MGGGFHLPEVVLDAADGHGVELLVCGAAGGVRELQFGQFAELEVGLMVTP